MKDKNSTDSYYHALLKGMKAYKYPFSTHNNIDLKRNFGNSTYI